MMNQTCRVRDSGRLPVIGMALVLAFLVALVSVTGQADVVSFPDPELEAAIRSAIGIPTGDILDTDLAGLRSLHAGSRGITNLEGIQHCVNLTSLSLWGNAIVDISPLSGLINLTELKLGFNQIADISPLAGLINLTYLRLDQNRIIDISPLAGLTNLEALFLGENALDLTPGSQTMLNIQVLKDRGVEVNLDPQN